MVKYPQHMIKCPTVEDRETMRVLIFKLRGLLNKQAYDVVMLALRKLEKEV